MKYSTYGDGKSLIFHSVSTKRSVVYPTSQQKGAILNYVANRQNGTVQDAPKIRMPVDGTGHLVDGDTYRYNEGPGDRAWMEECDRNYISRLVREQSAGKSLLAKELSDIEEGMRRADIAQRITKEKLVTLPEALNEQDEEEEKTPLMHAIINKHDDLANWLLLQSGIEINLVSVAGKTALHYAVEIDNLKLVRALIADGADVLIKDVLNQTPLDIAMKNEFGTIVGILQRAAKNQTSKEQNVSTQPSALSPMSSANKIELTLSSSPAAMSHQDLREIPSSALSYKTEIGQGAYGTVWLGQWNFSAVAIKRLMTGNLTDQTKSELIQEATLMQQLQFPHIAQIYGVCVEPGKAAIVMEYMPRGSLFTLLHQQGEIQWTIRYQFAMDIGMGLSYLHLNHILHRDLKSPNVLVTNDNRAKLTDFGLATVKKEVKSSSTRNNAAGTLLWMAPELFGRGGKASQASDVYSYGMTMWEIASRKRPFEDAESPEIAKDWVKEGEREKIPSDTPKSMAELIGQCWDKRQEARPSAEQAVQKLESERPAEFASAPDNPSGDSSNHSSSSMPSFLGNFTSGK